VAGDERSPALALAVTGSGEPPAVIERVRRWRDVLLRTAADGVAGWSLATDEVFMLGDFPSGSRDCRHFGPLDRPALRQRVGGR
jgi:type IV secretory pathway protease TraF